MSSAGSCSGSGKKGGARQRHAGAVTAAQPSSEAPTATEGTAASSEVKTAAQVIHANQSRSTASSSAHICSNTESCPLIAAWKALPADERDAMPLSEELLACSACRSVLYCSRECQRDHWHSGHKERCPILAGKSSDDGNAAASSGVAAASSSSAAAAAVQPAAPGGVAVAAPPHRVYNLNINLVFGPRALIVTAVVLYLIYRALYRHSGDSGHGGGGDSEPPLIREL